MALIAFYLLASLIFLNAGATSVVMLPRIMDQRFRLSLVLSLALAISTFTAFITLSWPILIASFGIYCQGQILDCLLFSNKSHKYLYPFIGIYLIAAAGSFLAFILNLKVLFLVTYIGYWVLNYLINKGYFKSLLFDSKE